MIVRNKKKENLIIYLFAFCLPMILIGILYWLSDIAPFGENTIAISDAVHQYLPFYNELCEKIKNKESLFYSWSGSLGYDFYSTITYYLSSPFSIIVIILHNIFGIEVAVGFNIILWLKLSTCGLTMSIYLINQAEELTKNKKLVILSFSFVYAMSNYNLGYGWCIMWLDVVMLTPIIVLALEKLIIEKKTLIYTLSLALAIITNYYISYMLCIFLLLWFIVTEIVVVSKDNQLKLKYILKDFIRFVSHSILSVGLSAFILIPTIVTLSQTESSTNTFPSITNLFKLNKPIDKIISSFKFLTTPVNLNLIEDTYSCETNNIYCGILVIFLCVCYLFNIHKSIKERIIKIALALFLLVSMDNVILDYIWHGFHYQNGIANRFGFLLIFALCVIAFEEVTYIQVIKRDELEYKLFNIGVSISLIYIMGYLLLMKYNFDFKYKNILYNLLFIIIVFSVLAYYKHYQSNNQFKMCCFFKAFLHMVKCTCFVLIIYFVTELSDIISHNDSLYDILSPTGVKGIYVINGLLLIIYYIILTGKQDNIKIIKIIFICLIIEISINSLAYVKSSRFTVTNINNTFYSLEELDCYSVQNENSDYYNSLNSFYDETLIEDMSIEEKEIYEKEKSIRENAVAKDGVEFNTMLKNNFNRVNNLCNTLVNENSYLRLKGLTMFNSNLNYNLSKVIKSLGIKTSMNSISSDGLTPFTKSIFSIKYTFNEFESVEEVDVLPLAFLGKEDLLNWNWNENNPFMVQNNLAYCIEDNFEYVYKLVHFDNIDIVTHNCNYTQLEEGNFKITIEKEKKGKAYMELNFKVNSDNNYYIYVDSNTLKEVKYYINDELINLLDIKFIEELSQTKKNDKVTIKFTFDKKIEDNELGVIIAEYLNEGLDNLYKQVMMNPFHLTTYTDNEIQGYIENKNTNDRILMTTIPYSKGWKCKIDNEEVEIIPLANAFIGLRISNGLHEIKLIYKPVGLSIGILITLITLMIIVINQYIIKRKRCKRR